MGPDARVHRGRARDHRPRGAGSSTSGAHYQLPIEGGTGQGKALKLNFHPVRNEIPVFVGAIGRKSVEMAAEICDGWIPIFFSADAFEETWGEHLEAGFAKGGRIARGPRDLAVALRSRSTATSTRRAAWSGRDSCSTSAEWARRRPTSTSTSRTASASARSPTRSRRSTSTAIASEAYAAIPDELVDATSLVGSEDEVAARIEKLAAAGVDRLICSPVHLDAGQRLHTVERMAALAGAPVGG